MAHWVAESGNFTLAVGQSTPGITYVNLTISSVIDGVWSGHHLSASNFKIGEATLNGGSGEWVGGNVDAEVASVLFTDNGTAGDPANTVNARVALSAGYNPSAAPETIWVDIDEIVVTNPVRPRSAYMLNKFVTYASGQTITTTAGSADLTYTAGSIVDLTRADTVAGTVDEGKSSLVSKVEFAATLDGGGVPTHFYKTDPTVSFVSLGDYEGDYFATVDTTKTNGSISSFVVKIFYHPNTTRASSGEQLRQHGHTALINYELQAKTAAVTNTITGLSYKKSVAYVGGSQSVSVVGIAGTNYNIAIQKRDSLTTTTTTAGAGAYYNFSTNVFDATNPGVLLSKIKSNGANYHNFTLPIAETSTRYDIVITSHAGSSSTILDSVGTAENKVIQYGRGVLTIKPTYLLDSSHVTVTGGDTTDVTEKAVKRVIRYAEDKYTNRLLTRIEAIGGTKGGLSDSRVILTKPNPKILGGMVVSGSNITHDTIVKSNVNGIVTLSRDSAVASGTALSFATNTANLVPFSFNVAPTEGGGNITASSGTTVYAIGGLTGVSILCDGTVTATKTVVLDNVNGLAVGMAATGTGIPADTTISGITNTTTITLSQTSNIVDDTRIDFSGGLFTNKTRLDSIKITANGNGSVDITGYIEIGEVYGSAVLPINLDSLLTVPRS